MAQRCTRTRLAALGVIVTIVLAACADEENEDTHDTFDACTLVDSDHVAIATGVEPEAGRDRSERTGKPSRNLVSCRYPPGTEEANDLDSDDSNQVTALMFRAHRLPENLPDDADADAAMSTVTDNGTSDDDDDREGKDCVDLAISGVDGAICPSSRAPFSAQANAVWKGYYVHVHIGSGATSRSSSMPAVRDGLQKVVEDLRNNLTESQFKEP